MRSAVYEFRVPRIPRCTLQAGILSASVSIPVLEGESLFPPRPILDLLCLIDDGAAEKIHLIEWVRLFNDLAGWADCAPLLTKKLVTSFLVEAMKREDVRFMALSRLSEYLGGFNGGLPEVVFDNLDSAAKEATGEAASALHLLLAFRDGRYAEIVNHCYRENLSPREYFEKHYLYFDWTKETSLAESLGQLAASEKNGFPYMVHCLKGMSDTGIVHALNQFVMSFKGEQFGKKTLPWVDAHLKPYQGKYWHRLSDDARRRMLSIYGAVSLHRLEALLSQIDAERKASGIDDRSSRNIQSRVRFWMNFTSSIQHFRLVLSKDDMNRYESALRGVNCTTYMHGGEGEPMVLLLDLEGVLVAQFLGGPVAEIRFFEWSGGAQKALFGGSFRNAGEIRRRGFDSYCDHVFGWQFVAEKLLRLKFKVLPNSKLANFIGLPKNIGKLDEFSGLVRRETKSVFVRYRDLDSWLRAFWKRECEIRGLAGLRNDELEKERKTFAAYPLRLLEEQEKNPFLDDLRYFAGYGVWKEKEDKKINGKASEKVELIANMTNRSLEEPRYLVLRSASNILDMVDMITSERVKLKDIDPIAVAPGLIGGVAQICLSRDSLKRLLSEIS